MQSQNHNISYIHQRFEAAMERAKSQLSIFFRRTGDSMFLFQFREWSELELKSLGKDLSSCDKCKIKTFHKVFYP